LLQTLVGEHKGSWDLKLAMQSLLYNTVVNRTISKLPHEIVYGFRPR